MASGMVSKSISLGNLLPEQTLSGELTRLAICGMAIDSRQVKSDYLFVAMQGLQAHGKNFIAQAIANGSIAVLIDLDETLEDVSIPVIRIRDLRSRLSAIAGQFFGHPSHSMRLVGVTGTNGKTTCTYLLAQAYAAMGKKVGIMGTLGYGLLEKVEDRFTIALRDTSMTTPDAIYSQKICAQMLDQGCELLAMEVSSHALAQKRVAGLAVDTAVFTNLTQDHLDYHGNMAAYGNAKLQLFTMPSLSLAVVNQDDPFAYKVIDCVGKHCKLITYSLEKRHSISARADAHLVLQDFVSSEAGMQAKLYSPEGTFHLTTSLIGRFNLSNLLAVIASLYGQGESLDLMVSRLSKLKPVPGRMELIANRLGVQVVVDYAHTPDALENALVALKSNLQGKLWCVFGCGGNRDREKRPEMARLAELHADYIVITSDNPRKEPAAQIFSDINAGLRTPVKPIVDRREAIKHAINSAKAGDVVLIAGKGHEDYQLIGDEKLPSGDQRQARLFLRQREAECGCA
ncbi:MAG: UDP-N-acetylmuramoyl-L-alanyl-D-glutamate--2,6-diaminopimelate ligase [Cellvibrionaceae bacterium]|jgi:UDP-N-acetylmuramoyl-L-alanyl-D-glutamate--2,6-diaminopimelate ligase